MAERAEKKPEDRMAYWRRHLAHCRRSGFTYAEYCRRHELTESAFGYWRKKLSAQAEEEPEFVELRVTPGDRAGIEIILRNEIRLVVHSDFDEAPLVKLVEVLEAL